MEAKKPYLLICEGDSEFAYVQELNRLLAKCGVPIVFLPHNAGGGGFGNVRQACRKLKTKRDGRTFVVADKDIYFRNDKGNGTAYERGKHLVPPFLFQTWNFEDFLLMHFSSELLAAWMADATRCGHGARPLPRCDYMPSFSEFCAKNNRVLNFSTPYEKGDMPFDLHAGHLECLFVNNETSAFPHSDFADFLRRVLPDRELYGDLRHG